MKKILLMLTLLFSVLVGVNAHVATENTKIFDNISIGVTAGVSTPMDLNSVFPLNTHIGLKVQKDFSTVFGLQAEGLAILNDKHFSDFKTMVKATNVGLNGVVNVSNLVLGYNGAPRVFEVNTVAGIGWLHAWDTYFNFLTAKTGLDLALNLGKKKAHSIVVTPAVYWNLNKFGKVQFNKHGAQLALNVTYMYHFKTSNGTHSFKTYDVGAMNDEINFLRRSLDECNDKDPVVVERIVEKVVPSPNAATVKSGNDLWIVTFATASSELTTEAKFILDQIGNDIIVDVTATASPDGPEKLNQVLSEKRAKNVADYLTTRGIKVNSWEGKGVNPKTGRSAIVKTMQ